MFSKYKKEFEINKSKSKDDSVEELRETVEIIYVEFPEQIVVLKI